MKNFDSNNVCTFIIFVLAVIVPVVQDLTSFDQVILTISSSPPPYYIAIVVKYFSFCLIVICLSYMIASLSYIIILI